MKSYTTYQKVLKILKKYDQYPNNPSFNNISKNIRGSIYRNEEIKLITFTCSTINDKYMFNQKTPWLYVNTACPGNNLETDIPTLKKLLNEISEMYPIKLFVIIGNTDPYYIYSESFSTYKELDTEFLWSKFSARWSRYESNLNTWLTENRLSNFEVINWYKFEKYIDNETGINFDNLFNKKLADIEKYFPNNDFEWELRKLKGAFGKNQYFPTLKKPDDKVLMRWIKRKFTEYMLQGFLIYTFFPRAILIQNEKPSLLRYNMYQPLINKIFKSELPNIYPYGIDNIGYQ